MRPDSIKKFDLFYLGAIAIDTIANYVWRGGLARQIADQFAAQPSNSGIVEGTPTSLAIALIVLYAAIQLLLWFLVSVRKIGLVRFLVVGLIAINLLSIPAILGALPALQPLVRLFVIALQLIAVFYLFRAESSLWFKGKRVVDENGDGHIDAE